MPILSAGEVLWDVFEEQELLGGAPLNFSVTMQRLAHSVALLTAVGSDARGQRALKMIRSLGLSTDLVQVVADQPTGTAVVTTDNAGNATFVIKRPAAFDRLTVDNGLLAQVEGLHPGWIYFGTLAQTQARNETLVRRIVERLPGIQCFYDMNLREGHWNLPLVQHLSALATVLKLNDAEAHLLHQAIGPSEPFSLERFCRDWSEAYGVRIMCITLGSKGCAIFAENKLYVFRGFAVEVVDTVGAGDSFAAAFLHGLLQYWPMEKQARFANAVGAVVASHAGATAYWDMGQVWNLMSSSETDVE